MMKFLVLALAACAVAEDYTETPFRWPDMLRNGGRIVHVLTSETNPKPAKELYPKWYNKYPLRFVEDVAVPPGEEVAGAEVVVLEYDITNKMGLGWEGQKQLAKTFGLMGQAVIDKVSPKHNELGIIAKAANGKELGRYAVSLWPIGNDEISDLTKDQRQRPRIINDTVVVLNRALVSVELSKANTWWGLPKDTKQIHIANLNLQGYKRAMKAIKDYAEQTQYFNDYDISTSSGSQVMPAATCNSMVEYVVKEATGAKVFDDGMAKIGYLNLHEGKGKGTSKPVSSSIIRGLMANKGPFKDHYNKDMYIVPAYYDKSGKPRPGMMKDAPEEWYVVWTDKINWRQNYLKAEQFQTRYGFKSAQVESEEFQHASDDDKNQNKKYVSTPKAETEKKNRDLHQKTSKKKGKKASFIENPIKEARAELEAKEIKEQVEEEKAEKVWSKPKIEAWYLNMEGHTDRQQCMELQLREQGFEPHRQEGVQWPKSQFGLGKASIDMAKIKASGLDDCAPNGINIKATSDHMAANVGEDILRANILSNYCGHKRLIEKLAKSNSTADYFLIFEDDAQLKPWFRLMLEDFIEHYKGPWSAVQIDPFYVKSGHLKGQNIIEGLPNEYKHKRIYHGGILSGIQTMLVKKDKIQDITTALNNNLAMPADHIGRYVDSMIAWKPYISTHPGWWGETVNEKCSKSVKASRIGNNVKEARKFLAKEGFEMELEEEQIDNSIGVNPEENGPMLVLNNLE